MKKLTFRNMYMRTTRNLLIIVSNTLAILSPMIIFSRHGWIRDDALKSNFTPEQLAEWQQNFRLEHDPRITKMGAFLRRTGLDELPQLINIFKGEMSFVGPRPIVEEELPLYGECAEKLISVKPGLTGYWQVYAAPDCTYAWRIEMDMHYIDNASLRIDAQIIRKTLSHR